MWIENWEEYYLTYPDARQEHIRMLESLLIEVNFTIKPGYLADWLSVAIHHNHQKCISKILDYLDVPDVGMSVKERVCYYQLLGNITDG